MKIANNGVTRIVLIGKTKVYKIPRFTRSWNHFLRGLLSNMEEGKCWRYNSGPYERGRSKLLCPVVWTSWGGWLLIMKKAYTLTEAQWNKMPYYNDEHRKYFPGDDTISNYAMFESRLVKIDYGELGVYGHSKNKPNEDIIA